MSLPDRISPYLDELVAIRRDLHAHPELGFEEERTAGIVADRLASWGIEVHRGIGKTGVVGVLRGAARYLAETRDFDGTAVFIFQPAEEGLGGARAMIADRLFERFPCDEIYALH